jgi:3-methylfumaryl-CoA hydratase
MAGEFDAWLGRVEAAEDVIAPAQARRLAATLDASCATLVGDLRAGAPLPLLWHWIGFLPETPMSGLGPDGHPQRGGFLPPVPLERRMWAGGRLTFHGPDLVIGAPIHKRSEIVKIAEKTGGAGRMVFVTVEHRLSGPGGLAVTEEHDIVYIAMPDRFSPPPPVPAPAAPLWREAAETGAVALFRYSACTFNGHRIHYDLDYAREAEKYPGLVVHGPLQATLILEAARRHAPGRRVARFAFRGVRPVFHFDSVSVLGEAESGGEQAVCTATGEGFVGMQGRVGWA